MSPGNCGAPGRFQQDVTHAADPLRRLCLLTALAWTLPTRGQAQSGTGTEARFARSSVLHYRVVSNRFPYWLNGELQWQQQQQRYRARLGYSLLGQERFQISVGLAGPEGLQPSQFTDHISRDLLVAFDWQQQRASFQGRATPVSLMPGAQDRLSALLQLGWLAARESTAITPGRRLSMQTLGSAGADVWTWRFLQQEWLTLPNGRHDGRKWVREPLEPQGQQLEVWLSPALGYLPARIRITEPDGGYVDQQWLASSDAKPA